MATAGLPQVGEEFGRFRIVRLLGRGGMGAVYAAEQHGLNREVALKVLLPEYADDFEFRERFIHEATVLAGIDHPHVVHVYDHGEHEGHLYIATQLVGSGDLAQHLSTQGPLPTTAALAMAEQMASALAAAHQRGVVHRDVKPGNVLLRSVGTKTGDGDMWAYLGDFGIASSGDSVHTATGAVVGTWRYLSPERCRGEVATASGDIYSVGCLLWAALTGEPPFGGTDVEVGMAHLQAPIPQLNESAGDPVSPLVNDIMLGTMAKEPEERIASANGLREEIRHARLVSQQHEAESLAGTADEGQNFASAGPRRGNLANAEAAADDDFGWSTDHVKDEENTRIQPASGDPRRLADDEGKSHGARGTMRVMQGRGNVLWVALLVLAVVAAGVGGVWWSQRDSASSNGDRADSPTRAWEPVQCAADSTEDLPACPTQVRDDVRLPTGDFDGDGFADAAVLGSNPKGEIVIQTLLTAADTSALRTWATLESVPERMLSGDVDGDGKTDVVLLTAVSGGLEVSVLRSTKYGLGEPEVRGQLPARFAQQGKFTMGDVDGDGKDDLVALGLPSEGIDIMVMRAGDGFAEVEVWTQLPTWTWQNMKITTGDVNGDGRSDLVSMGRPPGGGVDLRVFPSTGNGFSRNQGWASIPDWNWDNARPVAGDYNGDGDADVAVVHTDGSAPDLGMYLSDGRQFQERVMWDTGTPIPYSRAMVGSGDSDGDGRDDLLVMKEVLAEDQEPPGTVEEEVHYAGDGQFNPTLMAAPLEWKWAPPV